MEFSDPDLAFLRHARFGELPAPARPEERVELVETDPRPDRPDTGLSAEQQQAMLAGG